MPIKCLASSLNQHCVNVSCYDSQFKFLEIGLVFVKLQINPSSVCLHSWPKTFGHLRMTAMTVMAEHHVCWWERTGLLPMAEGNCSFNPKQILLLSASLSQRWSGWESWITLSLFIYKSIYQQNSKCPPLLTDEVTKELTGQVTGSGILHPTVSCMLNIRSKWKRNHERTKPTFHVQD